MGGSSKHVLPVYLDGAKQTIAPGDFESNVANWNGLTSSVEVSDGLGASSKVRLGVPNHYGTVVFVLSKDTNTSIKVCDYTTGSDVVAKTLNSANESLTLMYNGTKWVEIANTEASLASSGANLDLSGDLTVDGDVSFFDSATSVTLADDTANALSFNAIGATAILKIDTTDSDEKVVVNGDLDVSDDVDCAGNVEVAGILKLESSKMTVTAQGVTAANNGAAQSVIGNGVTKVQITSTQNATDYVVLPTPVAGAKITVIAGTAACQIRPNDPTTESINNGTAVAGGHIDLAANQITEFVAMSSTKWFAEKYDVANGRMGSAGDSDAS